MIIDKSSSIIPDCAETKKVVKKITSFYTYETIKNFIGADKVDIIKIDTEGTEPEVIKTLESLVRKDLPLIFIEVLKLQKDNALKISRDQDLCSYIKKLDYIIFRINKNLKNKFTSIEEINSFGDYSDNIYADHLLIPIDKVNIYKMFKDLINYFKILLIVNNDLCYKYIFSNIGGVLKRSTRADCKSAGSAFAGSNPPPSTINYYIL